MPGMKQTEILDFTLLDEITGGDDQFKSEIIATFLSEIDLDLAQIKAKTEQNDWNGLAGAVHKIKSSLSMFCPTHLVEQLKKLETNAKQNAPQRELKEDSFLIQDVIKNLVFELKLL